MSSTSSSPARKQTHPCASTVLRIPYSRPAPVARPGGGPRWAGAAMSAESVHAAADGRQVQSVPSFRAGGRHVAYASSLRCGCRSRGRTSRRRCRRRWRTRCSTPRTLTCTRLRVRRCSPVLSMTSTPTALSTAHTRNTTWLGVNPDTTYQVVLVIFGSPSCGGALARFPEHDRDHERGGEWQRKPAVPRRAPEPSAVAGRDRLAVPVGRRPCLRHRLRDRDRRLRPAKDASRTRFWNTHSTRRCAMVADATDVAPALEERGIRAGPRPEAGPPATSLRGGRPRSPPAPPTPFGARRAGRWPRTTEPRPGRSPPIHLFKLRRSSAQASRRVHAAVVSAARLPAPRAGPSRRWAQWEGIRLRSAVAEELRRSKRNVATVAAYRCLRATRSECWSLVQVVLSDSRGWPGVGLTATRRNREALPVPAWADLIEAGLAWRRDGAGFSLFSSVGCDTVAVETGEGGTWGSSGGCRFRWRSRGETRATRRGRRRPCRPRLRYSRGRSTTREGVMSWSWRRRLLLAVVGLAAVLFVVPAAGALSRAVVFTVCAVPEPAPAGFECGTIDVPLDRANPGAGTIPLAFQLFPHSGAAALPSEASHPVVSFGRAGGLEHGVLGALVFPISVAA